MASDDSADTSLTVGQSINVIIEHSTDNFIAGIFARDGKIFRGVLMAENER